MSADFETEIKFDFINEALQLLDEAEDSFMALEQSPDPRPLLDRIFRLAHNLKGGSRAVGFAQVAEFTHQLEDLVQKIQKGEVRLVSDLVTTLLHANDRLVEMMTGLKADLNATFENADVLHEIQGWLTGRPVVQTATPPAENFAEELNDISSDISGAEKPPEVPNSQAFFSIEDASSEPLPAAASEDEPSAQPAAAQKATAVADKRGKDDEIIRVSLGRINQLNDFVGELIVLQSVVQQQASNGNAIALQASIQQVAKLSKDIQSLSMSLRMLPVKPLVQKLQRVVRDTSKALDKEVLFEIDGEQMEIDKSVLDRLSDPLIHILRNAVDHGLEPTSDRVASGKSPEGRVRLSFSNEGNHLVVVITDDGKGIPTEIVRRKAIEKGIIKENQELTEKQIVHLIFHPGFSTKSVTSEISGRGVGMDVVKTNVENIGGSVDVQTTLGKGSVFKLQIPLSLAVIEGLVVCSEKSRYVVPLSQVQETINLKAQKVFPNRSGIGNCFNLRGTIVPLYSADEALGVKNSAPNLEGTALIVNVEDRPMGFVVHDILRAQQIVIKPLGNGIVSQKGWIGSCVLGDGLPSLILSPIDLLAGRVSYHHGNNISGESA